MRYSRAALALIALLSMVAALSEISAEALRARPVLRGSTALHTHTSPREALYRPRDPQILQADALAAQYRLAAAEALYRQTLRKNPHHPGALNGLGKVTFYRTASSNPHDREQIAALQGKAIQYWMDALRYAPGYAEARLNLAEAYMAQNRLGEADDEIGRAMRLTPQNARVWADRGQWLVLNKRYNEALPILEKAVRLDARNVSAHYQLAIVREASNESDAALQNLQTVLWLAPHHAAAHERMARIYEAGGNEAAAVEHYLQALSLKPEMTGARLRLAALYERRGDRSEALAQLKNALSQGTEPDWELTARTARLSLQNEQPEVAIALYRAHLQDDPDDAPRIAPLISEAEARLAALKLRDPDLFSQGEAARHAELALLPNPDNFDARLIRSRFGMEAAPGLESAELYGFWEQGSLNLPPPSAGSPTTQVGSIVLQTPPSSNGAPPLQSASPSVGRSFIQSPSLPSGDNPLQSPAPATGNSNLQSPPPAAGEGRVGGPDPAVWDALLRKPAYQPGSFFEKGKILLARYQFEAAMQAFREARRAGEGKYSPIAFGELFLNLGLPDLAEESFRVALVATPGDLGARTGLVRVAQARRQSDESVADAERDARRKKSIPTAVTRLESAIRLNRMNARAYELLARLEEKRGHPSAASDYRYARLQL